jgi:hypothetical protein
MDAAELERLLPTFAKMCDHYNCQGSAEYGFYGTSPFLCVAHRLAGMICFDQGDHLCNMNSCSTDVDISSADESFSPVKEQNKSKTKPKHNRQSKQWTEKSRFDSNSSQLLNVSSTFAIPVCVHYLRHADNTPFKKLKSYKGLKSHVQQFYCQAYCRFQCPFEVKLEWFHETGVAVLSFREAHVHDYTADKEDVYEKSWGIAPHVQQFITKLVTKDKRTKPKAILRIIREEGIVPKPEVGQLRNYVKRIRDSLCSSLPKEDYSSLFKWIQDHQYSENLQDDEMFVLPGAVLPESLLWDDASRTRVIFCISTKCLLRNAVYQQDTTQPTIQLSDGTFNLLANGWPTLVLGTVDWDHKFKLEALGVSSHHDEGAFQQMYESTSAGVALICPGRILKADYTMQDGAREIFNATNTVLKPKVVASCLFHAAQAIEKKKGEFKDKNAYKAFRANFKTLQSVQSQTIFHNAASLLIEKWNRKEPAIAAWYDDEYLTWRQTSYCCATPPGVPGTNNPNENFNGKLKLEGTERERG